MQQGMTAQTGFLVQLARGSFTRLLALLYLAARKIPFAAFLAHEQHPLPMKADDRRSVLGG